MRFFVKVLIEMNFNIGNGLISRCLLKCKLYWVASKVYMNPSGVYSLLAPGRVAQSVGRLTRKSGVLGSIPGLATYFRFSFRFFKKGSCQ